MSPEKVIAFSATSFSANSIARRVKNLGRNVWQLKDKAWEFERFAVDKEQSTDVLETSVDCCLSQE